MSERNEAAIMLDVAFAVESATIAADGARELANDLDVFVWHDDVIVERMDDIIAAAKRAVAAMEKAKEGMK